MNPKDTTFSRSPVCAPKPKAALIRARSSCRLSCEVSITRSASPRTPCSSSRSAAMPSITRPPSCSGCGRRTLSNLRTRVSSLASRNTTNGRVPPPSRSPMTDFRLVENARLRTSTTAASLGTALWARRARSSMVGRRSGGRLSATNQSRSSSDFAAVLRPAPDRPVMMTISGALLAGSGGLSGLMAHLPPRSSRSWRPPPRAARFVASPAPSRRHLRSRRCGSLAAPRRPSPRFAARSRAGRLSAPR